VSTAPALAPWTPVPRQVWVALRRILEPHVGVTFTIPGDPVPKHRPRLGEGGTTYTPDATKKAEKRVRQAFKAAMPGWPAEYDRTYGAMIEFRTKSTSKVDIDNAQKLVMDALNKVMWGDDIQVGRLHLDLVRDGEPGIEVKVFAVEPNGTPMSKLCECGARFRSKERMCYECRKKKRIINALLADPDDAALAAERLDRDRRAVFSYVTARKIGTNATPSLADIAKHAGITTDRVQSVLTTLISDGYMERKGRQLKIIKPLGVAA
jgi:crossover junction endodeoxyribonuclease RusA